MTDLAHEFETALPLLDPLKFAEASRDADVLKLVKTALSVGRARLAVQPVVIAADPKQVAFYEGLIRVMDDQNRIIPAAHFMPVIEDTDLGRQIDVATLQLAFHMLGKAPSMRLSINVSARSLGDSRWRRALNTGLKANGSLGERLIFEITEGSAMYLHEVLKQFMDEMQPQGVGFALDSFGAGMTSFRHLKDLLFDIIKIDKSFAKGVAQDADNQVLCEALITLGQQFGMMSVADGVESAEDAAFLQNSGADFLQGYHFGVPRFLKS